MSNWTLKSLIFYRRHDFLSRFFTICIGRNFTQLCAIWCNRMKSYLIRWNHKELGAIFSDLWTVIFHRICLNKTARSTANCYYRVAIDYDIIVTAFLCVLLPGKKCWRTKQTTITVMSRLQRSFIVQSEPHQWQWKIRNVWHVDRNFLILHLLKIYVKIVLLLGFERNETLIVSDGIGRNREQKLCHVWGLTQDAISSQDLLQFLPIA